MFMPYFLNLSDKQLIKSKVFFKAQDIGMKSTSQSGIEWGYWLLWKFLLKFS